MLLVQTADEVLCVPEGEVASVMPVFPDRWRVVLGDGRVGHRTGAVPEGPWLALGDGWVRPEWLRREGDFWVDPAEYRYAYEPLGESPVLEQEDDGLPAGLLTVESRDGDWFWCTETGEFPSDLKRAQLLDLYPQLALVSEKLLVYLPRVRRLRPGDGCGYLWLDQGLQLRTAHSLYYNLAARFGLETFATIDPSVPSTMWKMRVFPYDLTSAEPERILRDCPSELLFCQQLFWQAAAQFARGQVNESARDMAGFARWVLRAARRCGFEMTDQRIYRWVQLVVQDQGLLRQRQLGLAEQNRERRLTGSRRPYVVLLAPAKRLEEAREAAQQAGISLLITGNRGRLPLEYLASELTGPLHLIAWEIPAADARSARQGFAQLGLESPCAPHALDDLGELERLLAGLTKPQEVRREPLRRIPLEGFEELYFADPEEIESWVPSPPGRWRVELKDGRVYHHPGPPDARSGGEGSRVLWLEERGDQAFWLWEDGSETAADLPFLEAGQQHPDLIRISKQRWVNFQRIRWGRFKKFCLDTGEEFRTPEGLLGKQLRDHLGILSATEVSADPHGLRALQLRDYPYEILRASAEQLRADFADLNALVGNVIWQVACGRYRYGDTFSGFFYRPLQAILYRAGYLTRTQMRQPLRSEASKLKLYYHFCTLLNRMVRQHRLFSYREFGFKDAFPDNRMIGTIQPQRILLVEKGDKLRRNALRLGRELGMSVVFLKGMPSLLHTEYFTYALREVWDGPVEIFFYGDFDHAGWDIGPAFRDQLRFLGVDCIRLERLVLPSCFGAEEAMLCSRPLVADAANYQSRIERFVRESGGVQGLARGIHANWLQPFGRVKERLEELLG